MTGKKTVKHSKLTMYKQNYTPFYYSEKYKCIFNSHNTTNRSQQCLFTAFVQANKGRYFLQVNEM